MQAQCQALQAEGRGPDSRLHSIDLEELRMGNTRLVHGIEERAQKVVQQKLATGRSAKVYPTSDFLNSSSRLCYSAADTLHFKT